MSKLIKLLQKSGLADLGPGPRQTRLSLSELEANFPQLGELAHPAEVRALVLLWNDHHDLAHAIVQDAASGDSALIHGILHRREPDFGNAAYWFRRVPNHPMFSRMTTGIGDILDAQSQIAMKVMNHGNWNPFAFIDLCAQAIRSGESSLVNLCKQLQWMETKCLAEHLLESQ